MTREEFNNISELDIKMHKAKYFINNGEIDNGNINYLFHNDTEFRADIVALRDLYLQKYTEKFKNIEINNYEV